jgi:hypothetical protein
VLIARQADRAISRAGYFAKPLSLANSKVDRS